MADLSEVASLRQRVVRLERWKTVAVLNLICTCLLVAAVLWALRRPGNSVQNTVRLHRLVVTDDAGKERIVLAAPLNDLPKVNGQESHRRVGVSAAIQFKEADGTERGGIALEEDGSFLFGIDDEHGRERAHLFYIPKRGSGVYLQSPGSKTVSLLDPPGNTGEPGLQILSSADTVIEQWPHESSSR